MRIEAEIISPGTSDLKLEKDGIIVVLTYDEICYITEMVDQERGESDTLDSLQTIMRWLS